MKNLKSYEIRDMWLRFFASHGHEIIQSAPLIPFDDPTLLWINAGVAPLKKYFDGREKPNNPRMTNAQKSIRTNDIDNVGKTARHHTFFEMLGNFSIGDYFRDEVIPWATELLFGKDWYDFPRDLIYITYYPKDVDTFNKWVENGVDPSHLIPLEDNFWEIGEGPCGPDTEIFFDRGTKYDPENIGIRLLKEDIENDRYIEIWNIVFSQFNSVSGLDRKDYPELPSKNIDTGSGLERLACIFQGTETNYETDLFMPLIKYVEDLSGVKYADPNKMAFRVIADHIRSVTFAVADGAMLSNEGRGYVLRRILRRAVRYGKKLGINEPFLYKMVSLVVENMKGFYPYLLEKQALVEKLVLKEEENFLKTLENGEKKINEIIESNKKNGLNTISGKDAFLLYDTFGFPYELTEEAASEKGMNVDQNGFNEELKAQKERARKARGNLQSMNSQNEDYMAFNAQCEFLGYNTLESKACITGIFKDGKKVDSASGEIIVALDKTPFYAEMGGQVGDNGTFIAAGETLEVVNCFKLPNGEAAHTVLANDVTLHVGDQIEAIVNADEREAICENHSATHIMNEALRKVLGSHVTQHGSAVSKDRLRFDFNHFNQISNEELLEIEKIVNQEIKASHEVITHIMSLDEAKKTGAQAVFGEKYGDTVRVVDMDFAKELCGGTHVKNTADIKKFAVISCESKGSGIFRLEAVTNDRIATAMQDANAANKEEILRLSQKVNAVIAELKENGITPNVNPIKVPQIEGSYQDIINYRDALDNARNAAKVVDKELDNFKRQSGSKDFMKYYAELKDYGKAKAIVVRIDNIAADVLKDIADKLSNQDSDTVIFIGDAVSSEKILFVCESKNKAINAGLLVRTAAQICSGNGGGRPDFAQAGGKDVSRLDEALEKVKELLA